MARTIKRPVLSEGAWLHPCHTAARKAASAAESVLIECRKADLEGLKLVAQIVLVAQRELCPSMLGALV